MWFVLRMALGGLASGFFLGNVAGAIMGLLYGTVVGNAAWGLDGAVAGGAVLAMVGAVYGTALALRENRLRPRAKDDALRTSIAPLVLMAALVITGAAHAEPEQAESVRIESADGVKLRGNYYAGKSRSPCVLLLHALGNDGQHEAWRALATALQKKGYGVLALDFRGHGDSTEVDPDTFWSASYPNRALVRGAPSDTIRFKDFNRRYYPILANDIAAARAFLDRKNDQGECNSSNLILIGADTGATLGALWLNAECHRYRIMPASIGSPMRPASRPEASRILCALWLDIGPTLGSQRVNLPALLDSAGRQQRIPLVFLYGQGDTEAQTLARSCERSLKQGVKLPYTGATPIAGAANASGRDLLQRRLGTERAILEYLDLLSEEKGSEWSEQDLETSTFAWKLPHGLNAWTPASTPGSRTPVFSTYEPFLR
jgi:pimeloyl-ACP methyl ester carboxylesterase